MVEVIDPAEISSLARNPALDRNFELRTCPVNWFLLRRSLSVLSLGGKRFPTMTPRDSERRQTEQERLWNSLSEEAAKIRSGPEELEPLARWVRGFGSSDELGILAQQLLGRLFSPGFKASAKSWTAAEVLVAAPRSCRLDKMLWWWLSGKVRRSKRLLAAMVDGNLSGLNAVGIAVHNLVRGICRMRSLYANVDVRRGLEPEEAARQCLFAPVSVYRQASAAVQSGPELFPPKSLFVLQIGAASKQDGGRPLVFMEDTWSRCPAAQWVPAMLEGLWRRATRSAHL